MIKGKELHKELDAYDSIDWLRSDFSIDREACRAAVDRLRAAWIIDEEFADNLRFALASSPHDDSRRFAYWLGVNILTWLAAFTNPTGCDNPRFDDYQTHMASWSPGEFWGNMPRRRRRKPKKTKC